MKNKKGQDEAIKGEELYEFNPNVLPEGQSSGDAKYEYCMNHLSVIPVETKLIIK